MSRKIRKLAAVFALYSILAGFLTFASSSPANASLSTRSKIINFDSAVDSDLTAFEDSAASVVASSSAPAGGPASGKVVKFNKYWSQYGGVILANLTGDEFISSQDKHVKALVYAPVSDQVIRMQLNNGNASTNLEADVRSLGGWQVMDFDFNSPVSGSYSESTNYTRATVFFNFNVGQCALRDDCSNDQTYNAQSGSFYIDDITYTSSTQQSQPQVIQTQAVQYDFESGKPAGWLGFSGAEGSDVENTPAGTGAPTGSKSGFILETSGGDIWQGLVIDERTTSELISSSSKVVQLKVKAPSGIPVTLKLESPGNDPNGTTPTLFVEKTVSTTSADWDLLTFDFAAPSRGTYTEASNYVKVVLFFNLSAKNNADGKMYFDDLAFTPNAVTLSSSSGTTTTSTVESSSVGVDPDNKGKYPHVRLDKGFLDTKFDASWWDGVWQYRDEDTKAYLKYIPVSSTFKLTYVVTGADNQPMIDVPVTLIVNANYSCSKTYFMYENSLIGPDDCSGGGQTELPAKRTDSYGRVSFVLTNTNTVGEAMPADLNGLPNGKELGTNIKPHLVGAEREGIDMLFAHFVQSSEKATVTASGSTTASTGQSNWTTFTFKDANGNPIVDAEVAYMINGFDSKSGYAATDRNGSVLIRSSNSSKAEGKQVIAVSLIRAGKLPITGSATVNWVSSAMTVAVTGAKASVVVGVANAQGKSIRISVNGKTYVKSAASNAVSYKLPASAGTKTVVVTVAGKVIKKTVTVSK